MAQKAFAPEHCSPFLHKMVPPMLFLLFLHIFSLKTSHCQSSSVAVEEAPVVETKFGPIRGFPTMVADGEGEKTVRTFLGIPFAKPPVNELRFEKPLAPKKWTKVRNATEMGPACFPWARKGMWVEESAHSEDCLFLNVLAPGWQSPDGRPFPVLVYVHGGGYQTGTARELRSDVLGRKYVLEGLVMVTFQYRIGQLGFAATGDEKFAGNYGLWDQKMALEFVRDNIAQFGGDPKRVTVWGFSAGSSSASALSISPQTAGLFQQIVQMSGSILANWGASNRPIAETERMAKEVGCKELEDSAKLKKCLKGKGVHELMDAVERMGASREDVNELLFTPRYDADFFPNEPLHLMQEVAPKRTLIGVTQFECLTFTLLERRDESEKCLFIQPKRWANFGRKDFEDFVQRIVAPEKAFGKAEARKVQKRLVDFYLGQEEGGQKAEFFLRKYVELNTDFMFLVPTLQEARAKAAQGWPVFLYQIDYFNRKYFPEEVPVKGSYHAVEIPAVFDIRHVVVPIEEYGEEDLAFAKVLLGAINNFVKNGDPSTSSLKWPPLSPERPLQFAQLNPSPKMKPSLAPENLQFWQNLNADFSFDIIRGIHKATLRSKDEL